MKKIIDILTMVQRFACRQTSDSIKYQYSSEISTIHSEITQKIIAQESPIGVDAEGITDCCRNRPVGMIQVGTKDNDIYLFRTGVNQKLITKGQIKLELNISRYRRILPIFLHI